MVAPTRNAVGRDRRASDGSEESNDPEDPAGLEDEQGEADPDQRAVYGYAEPRTARLPPLIDISNNDGAGGGSRTIRDTHIQAVGRPRVAPHRHHPRARSARARRAALVRDPPDLRGTAASRSFARWRLRTGRDEADDSRRGPGDPLFVDDEAAQRRTSVPASKAILPSGPIPRPEHPAVISFLAGPSSPRAYHEARTIRAARPPRGSSPQRSRCARPPS